jgi:hypothetical protein
MPANSRIWLAFALAFVIVGSAQAAQINETQLEILLDLAEEWPVLKGLSTGAWVLPGLNGSCDSQLAYGIAECDVNGWVTKVRFENVALGAMGSEFGRMVAVNEAYFYNAFSGTMSPSWSTLESLEKLTIDGNAGSTPLTGPYPDTWASLTNLKHMVLQRISLGTTIPDAMLASPALRYLRLSAAGILGPLPSSLGEHQLEHLTIESDPTVGGGFPASIASNAYFKDLFLKGLGLTGSLPQDFSGASSLISFGLNNNVLSGSLPSIWPTTTNLRNLWWPYNAFDGDIPQSFMDIPMISQIDLSNSQLSGAVRLPAGSNANLAILDLSSNALTGDLPSNLFDYESLTTFRAGGNTNLGGIIPSSIPASCNLRELRLDGNNHTGSLPEDINNCSMLTDFHVPGNQLTGTIPAAFGGMPLLAHLDLSNNDLEGTIPDDWTAGGSSALRSIDLSANRLNGTIPNTLLELLENAVLDTLLLQNNNFSLCGSEVMTSTTIPSDTTCNVADQVPEPCGCNELWTVCLATAMPACNPSPSSPSAPEGASSSLSFSLLLTVAIALLSALGQ